MNPWNGLIHTPRPSATYVLGPGYLALRTFRMPSKSSALHGNGTRKQKETLTANLLKAGFIVRVSRGIYLTTELGCAAMTVYEQRASRR